MTEKDRSTEDYQHIPDELLLQWQQDTLTVPLKQMIGKAGKTVFQSH